MISMSECVTSWKFEEEKRKETNWGTYRTGQYLGKIINLKGQFVRNILRG